MDITFGRDVASVINDYIYHNEHKAKMTPLFKFMIVMHKKFDYSYSIWLPKKAYKFRMEREFMMNNGFPFDTICKYKRILMCMTD